MRVYWWECELKDSVRELREPIEWNKKKTEGIVCLSSIKNAVFVSPKHKTNKGNTEHKTNNEKWKIKLGRKMSDVGNDCVGGLCECVRESFLLICVREDVCGKRKRMRVGGRGNVNEDVGSLIYE